MPGLVEAIHISPEKSELPHAVESVNVGGRPASLGSDRWVFRADGTMSILSRGKAIDARDYTPCGNCSRIQSGPSSRRR